MSEVDRPAIFELHKRWIELENEHHQLEAAMMQATLGGADLSLLRDRQAKLLLEINALVLQIGEAPATTLADCLALLDVILEHETDLAADIAFHGASDYPMLTRLLRMLAEMTPGFEFSSLRRWASSARRYKQMVGERPADRLDQTFIQTRR